VAILRGLEDGDIGFLWIQVTKPVPVEPEHQPLTRRRAR